MSSETSMSIPVNPTSSLARVERDEASSTFFDATAQGRLLLRRCGDCQHIRGPEVPMCTECLSESFAWFDAAGTGHLESWVVVHSRAGADGVVSAPRIIATVELTEGPWIIGALIDTETDRVVGSMPVIVAFERPLDSESIPVFRSA
jgi:uncharacterized protein